MNDLIRWEFIEKREYQINIAKNALKRNTLVVLPTGMGKTLIGIMVAAKRLEIFPESKILFLAPTKPLCAQHKRTFEKLTTLDPNDICLVTGKIRPEKRKSLYEQSKVIVATPQTIENDVKGGRLSLSDFSLIIFDEAHRAVGAYAYNFIAKNYLQTSRFPLILALTASPGGTAEKIEEIRKNLFIKQVEVRTERDEDVRKYVKGVKKEWIYVELPEEWLMIKGLLEKVVKENLDWLKEHGLISKKRMGKADILKLQAKIAEHYRMHKSSFLGIAMSKAAEVVKIEHALELLETQDIESVRNYFEKLRKSKKRVDRRIYNDLRIRDCIELIDNLEESKKEHPKMKVLRDLVKALLKRNPEAKIIIFANFRETVEKIKEILRSEDVKTEVLIGQATRGKKGMKQEEQIEILKRFERGDFNVLCGTQITEEGLDVPAVDYAIFYEPVPSEIRNVQRRGRVGRQTSGKIFFLITKGTRDEAYYWAAFHKERKMRKILYSMKDKEIKRTLLDWLK